MRLKFPMSINKLFMGLIPFLLTFTACSALQKAEGTLPGGKASQEAELLEDAYFNVYEIFVGSFYDSDGDGVGDLRGVTEKLDYISHPETGLGADAIWLMPIMPSPTYHKYDVTDYMAIDSSYGSMEDFEALIAACNERGVALIMDLILNHTSTAHSWFQEALAEIQQQKEFNYVNYYNFTPTKYSSNYYPVDGGYFYEGVFWSEMPDLNMDNSDVRNEIADIAAFWLNKGVAGFRLDAAKHVYAAHKDNIPFWTWFTETCRNIKPDVYLVAEVWDSDAVMVPYYQTGLDSLFNFGFAGQTGNIATAVNKENGRDFAARIESYDYIVRKQKEKAIPANFLSNHDTDRSAGYFGSDEGKMKLAASLYMLMPGNSYIYYGEEIAMTGKGKDENKRAPMLWSMSANRTGATDGPADMTETPALAEGVTEQLAREDSLLNRYRDLIAIKNKYPAIARGIPSTVKTSEKSICAYETVWQDQCVLIVHNVSADTRTVLIEKEVALAEVISDAAACAWDGERLTIPGYSTVILLPTT